MAIEIVDLPIKNVDVPIFLYVLPEGIVYGCAVGMGHTWSG